MSFRQITALILTSVFTASSLVACGTQKEADDSTIRIGTTDSTQKVWAALEKKASENGIKLKVTQYKDYNQPNRALSEGQLDANLFQHLKFLAEYNVGTKDNLTPVGSTQIVPLALFWKDHTSLDDIDGKEVTIPNDPSNQGRAINVLVQARLVKLKKEGLITPTPADIDENASKVKVTPVAAEQTANSYGEGLPAIINNSYLDRANIDPKSSVFKDDPSSPEAEPYINVFVTKSDKQDNEKISKLVELWHTPEVIAANNEDSAGTAIVVDRPKSELQSILKRLEEDQSKSKEQ